MSRLAAASSIPQHMSTASALNKPSSSFLLLLLVLLLLLLLLLLLYFPCPPRAQLFTRSSSNKHSFRPRFCQYPFTCWQAALYPGASAHTASSCCCAIPSYTPLAVYHNLTPSRLLTDLQSSVLPLLLLRQQQGTRLQNHAKIMPRLRLNQAPVGHATRLLPPSKCDPNTSLFLFLFLARTHTLLYSLTPSCATR